MFLKMNIFFLYFLAYEIIKMELKVYMLLKMSTLAHYVVA